MIDEDLESLGWKKKNRSGVGNRVDDEMQSVCVQEHNAINVDVSPSRFSSLLGWLKKAANDPCSKKLSSLPELSKLKYSGSQEMWKQVLLAREALLVRKPDAGDSKWQKNQKMHPLMYSEQSGYSYHLRDRLNCLKFARKSNRTSLCSDSNSYSTHRIEDRSPSAHTILVDGNCDGNTTSDSSTRDSLFCSQPQHRILVGLLFQAEVPKWDGLVSPESDSKWSGTQVWPLLKPSRRNLIERDPIGTGRQDTCGCTKSGSVNSVRFHVSEKRFKLKIELGSAFFSWGFDKMGDEAILPWTRQEEDKFSEVVKLNPSSELKSFWDELLVAFPRKRREELIGYYYNVFLLKRREHQNRHYPLVITSDDDDYDESRSSMSEKWTNSIFCSTMIQKSNT
ncbi:hypothetical protein MLD38_036389 [Melastoma candidum]|uniref:Uncharacterized protein n=1 Tax=Melastoma candidum TaxID=119954 RepID=A0ACB9LKH4_9MYRT|nr:hypothetical protein MLD38_036389 [Melastoma candidum]